MRKIILIFILSIFFKTVYSQFDSARVGLFLSFGFNKDMLNHSDLDLWTSTHFNTTMKPNVAGGALDLGYIGLNTDGGFQWTENAPFRFLTIYYGKNIFRSNIFRSFINFQLGSFSAGRFYDFAPLNYIPTSSQIGKALALNFSTWSFGISLKNIFVLAPNGDAIYTKAFILNSLEIKFSYMPFQGHWDYGYYEQQSKGWHSLGVNGLPSVSKFCLSITYCLGILGSNCKK